LCATSRTTVPEERRDVGIGEQVRIRTRGAALVGLSGGGRCVVTTGLFSDSEVRRSERLLLAIRNAEAQLHSHHHVALASYLHGRPGLGFNLRRKAEKR
jgi:hypothetical protein